MKEIYSKHLEAIDKVIYTKIGEYINHPDISEDSCKEHTKITLQAIVDVLGSLKGDYQLDTEVHYRGNDRLPYIFVSGLQIKNIINKIKKQIEQL